MAKPVTWTRTDSKLSMRDGWLISLAHPSNRAPEYQLQRFDEDRHDRFQDDGEAWEHVYARSLQGSRLHKKALAYLEEQNPAEYRSIVDFGKARQRLAEVMTGPPIPKLKAEDDA